MNDLHNKIVKCQHNNLYRHRIVFVLDEVRQDDIAKDFPIR